MEYSEHVAHMQHGMVQRTSTNREITEDIWKKKHTEKRFTNDTRKRKSSESREIETEKTAEKTQ